MLVHSSMTYLNQAYYPTQNPSPEKLKKPKPKLNESVIMVELITY